MGKIAIILNYSKIYMRSTLQQPVILKVFLTLANNI